MTKRTAIWRLTILTLVKTSCAKLKNAQLQSQVAKSNCNHQNAIGLLDLLTEYVNLKKDYKISPTLEKRIEIVELSQRISQRINISSLEISAVASEMDCEEERANQIATYLKGKEDDADVPGAVGARHRRSSIGEGRRRKSPCKKHPKSSKPHFL